MKDPYKNVETLRFFRLIIHTFRKPDDIGEGPCTIRKERFKGLEWDRMGKQSDSG